MEEELEKMGEESRHDRSATGLSIKDARHDLVNPFLSSGKNIQDRILNPELKPLGEKKKVRFRDWHSGRDAATADAAIEHEQAEEPVKEIEETIPGPLFMEESAEGIADTELEKKEEITERKAEEAEREIKVPESEELEMEEAEPAELEEQPEPEIEGLEELQESEEPAELEEELEAENLLEATAEVLEILEEVAENQEEPKEVTGRAKEELEEQPEPEIEGPEESQESEEPTVLEEELEAKNLLEATAEVLEILEEVAENQEEPAVVREEDPENTNMVLKLEDSEAVWQQSAEKTEVLVEEQDEYTEPKADNGKAGIVAEQSDAPIPHNRIITTSISRGFGQSTEEEEKAKTKKGISFINKRRR